MEKYHMNRARNIFIFTLISLFLIESQIKQLIQSAEASVPTCVKISSSISQGESIATLTNDCDEPQQLRLDWAYAYDTGCISVVDSTTVTRQKTWKFAWIQPYVRQLSDC